MAGFHRDTRGKCGGAALWRRQFAAKTDLEKLTSAEKDKEIISLKNKIFSLSNTIEYWKNRFEKLIDFLHSKIHNWFDRDDKYIDVINDMYQDNVLDVEDINDLELEKNEEDLEI